MINHSSRIHHILLAVTLCFTFWSASADAQIAAAPDPGQRADPGTGATTNAKSSGPNNTVFGSVSDNRLRFAALGELLELRLEVITPSGEGLFDSGFKAGNVLDWTAADLQGQALAEATYLCIITVKDAAGKLTNHRALMIAHDQALSLRQVEPALLAPAQAQAAGKGADADEGITLVEGGASAATAILAHDGRAAHLVSGSGGLVISSGNFFANKIMEHVRLTAEGNLGIGTTNPQARLDVNGFIRASQGIVFPDGSVQYSASRKTFGAASLGPGQFQQKLAAGQEHLAPDIGGTGTTDKLAKWTDGPNGILGDSLITEANTNIGINTTPDPRFKLDVLGFNRFRAPNASFYLSGFKAGGNDWVYQTVDDNGRFRIWGGTNTTGAERLTIMLDTGDVGIGVTPPTAKLDVAGAINTTTQYNIGGSKILSVNGPHNGTGIILMTNTFVGDLAGSNTTPDPIINNGGGKSNAFFGVAAGKENLMGSSNSYFGAFAGRDTKGGGNSFFGTGAGFTDTMGSNNSFFGFSAGFNAANTTGIYNSLLGADSKVTANLSNQTAIGGQAMVTQSNSLVLGSIAGVNGATADTFVGIGTTAPTRKLEVAGSALIYPTSGHGQLTIRNRSNTNYSQVIFSDDQGTYRSYIGYVGANAGFGSRNDTVEFGTNGKDLTFRPSETEVMRLATSGNVGIGTAPTAAKLNVNTSGSIGLIVTTGTAGGSVAEFGSKGDFDIDSSTFVGGRFKVLEDSTVLINNPPPGTATEPGLRLIVNGVIKAGYPSGAFNVLLCHDPLQRIVECSSSIRYKENVHNYAPGLNLLLRLRPVSFNWKQGGEPDMGLIAEEVAKVEPLLVTHNAKGEIEGVKYDRIAVVLLNAVKAQQAQIREQSEQIRKQQSQLQNQEQLLKRQQAQLADLKRLVCKRSRHRRARN